MHPRNCSHPGRWLHGDRQGNLQECPCWRRPTPAAPGKTSPSAFIWLAGWIYPSLRVITKGWKIDCCGGFEDWRTWIWAAGHVIPALVIGRGLDRCRDQLFWKRQTFPITWVVYAAHFQIPWWWNGLTMTPACLGIGSGVIAVASRGRFRFQFSSDPWICLRAPMCRWRIWRVIRPGHEQSRFEAGCTAALPSLALRIAPSMA